MGIDLGDVVIKHPTTLKDLHGQTVAFDAWNVLYQFLSNIRQPDGTPLMDAQGRVTSHLAGCLYRTANLVEAGIKPVFVFDGEPHHLKRETLAARSERRKQAEADYAEAKASGDDEKAFSKAQQTSKMTSDMADEAKHLLRSLGIPVIEAPSEGEAQAAWMAKEGIVDAAASQDFDALLFGTPRLLRNVTVTGRRKLPGKQVWVDVTPEEIRLEESLAKAELTREQLVDAALLVGTDFNPGIKGIGPKKALALIQKEGSLEALIERLSGNPESATKAVERSILEQHEALMDRDVIRDIFLRPVHADVELEKSRADGDAVRTFMVKERGFSQERVDAALRRFDVAAEAKKQTGLFEFGA
ncbi:MAG: flap endonuclease-1 [Thermoplasmatota archaeon]